MSKVIFRRDLPVRDLAAANAFYVALGGGVTQFSDEQAKSVCSRTQSA
jgi:predicted lactoylglutathione lyase